MSGLADYRAHVERLAALPGSVSDDDMFAIVVDEASALDPACNVALRESISDAEWPAWQVMMRRQRSECLALDRRRQSHQAGIIAARLLAEGDEGVQVPDGPIAFEVLTIVVRAYRNLAGTVELCCSPVEGEASLCDRVRAAGDAQRRDATR